MVLNRDAKHKRTSREIDAKYIAQGRAMHIKYDKSWEDEVQEMNRGKVGRPYKYAHSMMFFAAMCRSVIDTGYRQCEGLLKESWGDGRVPRYATIWQRAGRTLPRFIKDSTFEPTRDGVVRLAADSTGMKTGNRGEWLRVMWNVNRGFFKMHVLVDLDTRRILAFSMSDVNGGDGQRLHGLLKEVLAKYTGGIPLPEPIAELVVDAMSEGALKSGGRQTLMDRWLHHDGEEGDKAKPKPKSPEGPDTARAKPDEYDPKTKGAAEELADAKKRLEDMNLQV